MESKLSVSSEERPQLKTFEQRCDICIDDSTEKASGYCQQCNQYLCKVCCDHHGRIVGTKHHTVRGKDETKVFGRETLFGRKLIPSSVIVIPPLPFTESSSIPEIKYVNFFRDIDKMIVLCWYPNNKVYAISEMKESKQERYSIGIVNNNFICLDTDNNQVIVIIPKSNVVSELDMSLPVFSEKEIFKTSGECKALVEFDNGFAAAIKMPTNYAVPEWQIHYLSRDGKIKKRIAYDTDGKAIFSGPKALASSHTQNTLYVLDTGKTNLSAFTIAGDLLFTFTHADMRSPTNLAVDKEDNIYVACVDKILQVKNDGTEHVIAIAYKLHQPNGLVAFNLARELLVVGDGTDKLQCFTFV